MSQPTPQQIAEGIVTQWSVWWMTREQAAQAIAAALTEAEQRGRQESSDELGEQIEKQTHEAERLRDDNVAITMTLATKLTDARQQAARECAELLIALIDDTHSYSCSTCDQLRTVLECVRIRFNLDATPHPPTAAEPPK